MLSHSRHDSLLVACTDNRSGGINHRTPHAKSFFFSVGLPVSFVNIDAYEKPKQKFK